MEQFSRTALLLGTEALETLRQSRVAVFGLGGVGGFVVEALVRGGVGALDLIDHDQVSLSNLNRQIIATHKTIGRDKIEVMEERILEINPDCQVRKHKVFYLPGEENPFNFKEFDYVVDAIDTVKGKIGIVMECAAAGVPVISCMGTGNKLDPTRLTVSDLSKTKVDPLARVMRRELKKRGIHHLKVVWSEEVPRKPVYEDDDRGLEEERMSERDKSDGSEPQNHAGVRVRRVPGSVSFVPSVAGLILAGEVIGDLVGRGDSHYQE